MKSLNIFTICRLSIISAMYLLHETPIYVRTMAWYSLLNLFQKSCPFSYMKKLIIKAGELQLSDSISSELLRNFISDYGMVYRVPAAVQVIKPYAMSISFHCYHGNLILFLLVL